MSDLISLEKALAFLLQDAEENASTVNVELRDAVGCMLTEEKHALINVPEFDNSAMDGYAVNSADISAAGCTLSVSQTIAAGHPGTPLERGTAAKIFTGAAIPNGADAVVIKENTRAENDEVEIMQMPAAGENIRVTGCDVQKGSVVLSKGRRIGPQDLGLLASLGISELSVKKPLTVAILNTGDEVIALGTPLKPGQIYDSNSYTLEALLKTLGMNVIKMGIVQDTLEQTEQALQQAAEQADCIISTGGVSVGDEDHVRAAVEKLGQLALWKLAIKPGKPFSYGRVNAKPFFGLPGNPVAVFVTFLLLVRPYLLKVQGAEPLEPATLQVPSGFDISKAGTRQEYIRVRLVNNHGAQELQAFNNQGSSIMTSISWADGLAEIPIGKTVSKGQLLKYFPFRSIL
ncbi:MAG: molybdopterin molybdenumtransferase MoeA [Gammaproteobacteria bacterium]|nr:molybdopterin molybdenumtransferase MoeA [Gammaproteobacteria bacterium]